MDSGMTWRSAHSVGENCNPTSCLTKLIIVFLIKYSPITCDNANTNCPLILLNQDLGEFGHLVLTLSHLKKHMQDTQRVSTSCSLFIQEGTCKCNFTSMLSCTLLDKLAWDFCRITVPTCMSDGIPGGIVQQVGCARALCIWPIFALLSDWRQWKQIVCSSILLFFGLAHVMPKSWV